MVNSRPAAADTSGGAAETVAAIRRHVGDDAPKIAIVLGSGLGGLADVVERSAVIPYGDIPGFPGSTVVGHSGELIVGRLADTPVLLQSGRFHLYEGHDPSTVARPVRAFAELGVETLIVTNAAGGLRPTFAPPMIMLIADHLNVMFRNPLVGRVEPGEVRFPDMSDPYDRELRALAHRVALRLGVSLPEGVYAGLLGPSYETPAEIRMLARLGADAVGMSTVPEAIAARARGIRVLGFSAITNLAAGISPTKLDHDEVLEAGREVGDRLIALVTGVVAELSTVK
jgi:purine-nucleoside phosphorylase